MGNVIHDVIHDVYGGHNEMGNRPISYRNVALQIFYASIFYPFANFRQLANGFRRQGHRQHLPKTHFISGGIPIAVEAV